MVDFMRSSGYGWTIHRGRGVKTVMNKMPEGLRGQLYFNSGLVEADNNVDSLTDMMRSRGDCYIINREGMMYGQLWK
jgi:hypothetical protein